MHIYIYARMRVFLIRLFQHRLQRLIFQEVWLEQPMERMVEHVMAVPNNRKEKIMNYYRWLIRKHRNDKTPAGEFAQAIIQDHGFPRRAGRTEILNYLIRQEACVKCIRAFEETWSEYARRDMCHKCHERIYEPRRRMRWRKGVVRT